MALKVTHLTSAHPRYDIRIFVKECRSLSKYYDVSLIVADSQGDEVKDNIHIYDVGKRLGRLNRMFRSTKDVYQKALELDSDVYHFHDPELIPVGLKLKKRGKKVIFDAHEDVAKQLLSKPYLNKYILKVLSIAFTIVEHYASQKFDTIVTATPVIREKYSQMNDRSIDINNYPIIGELARSRPWIEKRNEVCYVGVIAKIRGIEGVVEAFSQVNNIYLNLVGNYSDKELEQRLQSEKGYQNIKTLGFLNRKEVAEVLSYSKAGIVTFHDLPNHVDSQPNKMFEYMSASLPIITSNFPMWKEVVEGNKCGICVDPYDSKAIAEAINFIIENPKEAQKMGGNGKKAVLEKYNWHNEEVKLLKLYKDIL